MTQPVAYEPSELLTMWADCRPRPSTVECYPTVMLRCAAVLLAGCAVAAFPLAAIAQDAGGAASGSALVVVIPGDKRFHQPGCALVRKAGSNVRAMKQAEAERRGLTAHDCGDPGAVARDAAAATNASKVLVQGNDKRYHTAGCKQLTAAATETTVEKAAKDHWPCPVCKPPVRQRTK